MILSFVSFLLIFFALCINRTQRNCVLLTLFCYTCQVILITLTWHVQTLICKLPTRKTRHNQNYILISQQKINRYFYCKALIRGISFIFSIISINQTITSTSTYYFPDSKSKTVISIIILLVYVMSFDRNVIILE